MLARSLRLSVWLFSLLGAGMFLYVCFGRLLYPLDLDFIEGAVMDHVVRLSEGKPIYIEPSLEFIPLAYMPLFTATSSLLARAFGPQLWEPRLLLLLCSLGIAAMVFAVVRAETRRATFGVAAAGIYLSCLGLAGGHYDVARPDSMMLCLALGGLTTLRFTTSARGAVVAGVLFTLGFFTKQHAVWLALAALLHVALDDRRRLLPFGLTVAVGCGGGFALLSWWLGPWFSFYTWDVPAHWSHISPGRLQRYFGERLLGTMGPLSLTMLSALLVLQRPWRGRAGLWTCLGLGALGTGVMASLDPGAFKHTFLPTIVTLAVAGPILLARLTDHAASTGFLPPLRAHCVAYVILTAQFLPLVYQPETQLARPNAPQVHAELMARIQAIPGPVHMLYHGFYTWQAGKGMHFHHLAFADIERAHGSWLERTQPDCLAKLVEPLRSGPGRPTLITDCPLENSGALFAQLAPHYRIKEQFGSRFSDALLPITGVPLQPMYVYEPIDAAPNGGVPVEASAPKPGR